MGQVQSCQDHETQWRQPREGKICFPTCLQPIGPTDHASLTAPKIQTQKKTCPTKRTTKGWSKHKANWSNRAILGEQGSSDSCQSRANTFILNKGIWSNPTTCSRKIFKQVSPKNPKDMANRALSKWTLLQFCWQRGRAGYQHPEVRSSPHTQRGKVSALGTSSNPQRGSTAARCVWHTLEKHIELVCSATAQKCTCILKDSVPGAQHRSLTV